MKTLAKLLTIPLMFTLLSCEAKEPTRENFQYRRVYTLGYELRDNDGDGRVDEIYNKDMLGTPIYVAEDPEFPHEINSFTRKMGINLRSSASDLLKATKDFDYDLAKQRYDDSQKRKKAKK